MRTSTGVFRVIKLCSIAVVSFALAACSTSQYAPVQDLGYSTAQRLTGNSVQRSPTSYQVRSGDTMFAIAWRFGWDYKKLAKINGISSPYTIYVGQVVYFNDTNDNKVINDSNVKGSVKKPVVTINKPIKKPVFTTNKSTKKPASTTAITTTKPSYNKVYNGPASVQWNWPVKGKVLKGFSNKGSAFQGIDLSSTIGKSVKAASSGIIVYAGSGIQGYGNLVVIKHNDTFLSAYAYNSRILVIEGATVSAGQAIAEVGKGPQLDPRLHFEIRKDGKPVNPLWYLPKL
jgi:lipoprotein NlpD